MSVKAECGLPYENLGAPNCSPQMLVTRRLIIMNRFADDGSENKFDLSVPWDLGFFDALLKNADRSKRIYPTAEADNVQDVQGDTVYETTPSGIRFFVQDGPKPVTMEFWGADPSYRGKLNSIDFGAAFMIGLDGSIIGDKSEAGFLKPIPISPTSFRARFMKATDSTIQKVMLDYDWLKSFCDEDLGIVTPSGIEVDVNMLDFQGLIEIVGTPGTPVVGATTIIPVNYVVCLSKLKDQIPAEGIQLGNETILNVTTGLPVVATALTEITPGNYEIDIPNQTSSDELEISTTGNIYDDATPVKVTIP